MIFRLITLLYSFLVFVLKCSQLSKKKLNFEKLTSTYYFVTCDYFVIIFYLKSSKFYHKIEFVQLEVDNIIKIENGFFGSPRIVLNIISFSAT